MGGNAFLDCSVEYNTGRGPYQIDDHYGDPKASPSPSPSPSPLLTGSGTKGMGRSDGGLLGRMAAAQAAASLPPPPPSPPLIAPHLSSQLRSAKEMKGKAHASAVAAKAAAHNAEKMKHPK